MANLNLSSISSGEYADMKSSVYSVNENKVLLDNISNVYNFENIIQLPMTFLRKYENIIKANLIEYKIDKSRYYRPEYVSYDLYGTTDLWYLILFVNDLKSPMELCFEDILVPNTLYTLEIINKLKSIDGVKSTHNNPKYIYRSLIKDINFSSNDIDKNSFIDDPTIKYEDSMDDLINTYFLITAKYLSRDLYYEVANPILGYESPVNFGFKPNINTQYRGISIEKDYNFVNMFLEKKLKPHTKYYIFKRYAGYMDLYLKNDEYKINKKIMEKELVDFSPTILTYDLREATIAPEYLKENLILKFNDKIYEPEIFKDKDNKEYYGIQIDRNKYEILFDGTAYYIVLFESEEEKEVLLLENKENTCINHSMNEWIFNDKNSPLIKIDEDSENLYFNEEYYYANGEYVYTLKNVLENNYSANVTYRIDINRDLKSNNNKLSNFQFLGFEFNVGYYCYNNKNIIFSPMVIEIITNELDENNNNISYKYSYPYGEIPGYEDYFDYSTEIIGDKNDYHQNKLYKYKRIIPIINNLNEKKLLDIKEIKVSTSINFIDESKNKNYKISFGTLKIFGFQFEDLIKEFITPNINTDFIKFKLEYKYDIDKTKYSTENETNYFEPYIFQGEEDILSLLDDKNNLNYLIKNSILEYKGQVKSVINPHKHTYDFYKEGEKNIYNNDYLTFTLHDLKLANNYILEMNLCNLVITEDYIKNNSINNLSFLNGYTFNNNYLEYKNFFKNNFQLKFNKSNNNYYLLNFGEPNLETNNASFKNNIKNEYINKNNFLINFNSYNFSVDTKDNKNIDLYEKFKNVKYNIEKKKIDKNIIYIKQEKNNYYSMPGGLYKSLNGKGNMKYQYYKCINDFYFNLYPITQNKIFRDNYLKLIQNEKSIKNIRKRTNNYSYYYIENNIILKIQKFKNTFSIYYKFDKEDDYKLFYRFNDFYNPLNNGTIEFNFINNLPFEKLEILSYKTAD